MSPKASSDTYNTNLMEKNLILVVKKNKFLVAILDDLGIPKEEKIFNSEKEVLDYLNSLSNIKHLLFYPSNLKTLFKNGKSVDDLIKIEEIKNQLKVVYQEGTEEQVFQLLLNIAPSFIFSLEEEEETENDINSITSMELDEIKLDDTDLNLEVSTLLQDEDDDDEMGIYETLTRILKSRVDFSIAVKYYSFPFLKKISSLLNVPIFDLPKIRRSLPTTLKETLEIFNNLEQRENLYYKFLQLTHFLIRLPPILDKSIKEFKKYYKVLDIEIDLEHLKERIIFLEKKSKENTYVYLPVYIIAKSLYHFLIEDANSQAEFRTNIVEIYSFFWHQQGIKTLSAEFILEELEKMWLENFVKFLDLDKLEEEDILMRYFYVFLFNKALQPDINLPPELENWSFDYALIPMPNLLKFSEQIQFSMKYPFYEYFHQLANITRDEGIKKILNTLEPFLKIEYKPYNLLLS